MSFHCTTKLWFNTILQNQMRSKIPFTSIKHVSYSIVHVRYRTSTLQWYQASLRALPLVLEKYLCTSLASALAESRRVCCVLLISLPSTAPWHAHARWLPTRKLMMVLKHKKKAFFFAGKINKINKHDAGITNVKISPNLGVMLPCSVFHFLILAALAQFTCVMHHD